MRVILSEDVKNLGQKGEVKSVSEGYARNFLLPKKLARPATETAVKEWETKKESEKKEAAEAKEKMAEIKRKLEGFELNLKSREKGGKLFGSISKKEIAAELKKQNFEIREENVVIPRPIKKTGEYEAEIDLGRGFSAKIKISVAGE